VLSYNPLRIFLPLGILLTVLGLAKLGYDWVDKDFRLAANTLLILFAAFQVFAIGLLADLFVRIAKPGDEVDPASM
jgi:polyisoprenyl-phosphate glycosyltransferase